MTNYAATANGGTTTSAAGSLLQWLTIGYVGLVVVLLYPITVLVRKCRKRRKRKSASKRAQAHDANKDKSVALVDHKSQPLARTPSGDTDTESESSSSDDDDDAQVGKFMFKCETCDNHYSTYEEAKHHENNECENNLNYRDMSQNGETGVDMAGLPVSFALEVHG